MHVARTIRGKVPVRFRSRLQIDNKRQNRLAQYDNYLTKTEKAMREIIEKLFTDDETGQRFTTKEVVVFGIIVPAVLMLMLGIVGVFD